MSKKKWSNDFSEWVESHLSRDYHTSKYYNNVANSVDSSIKFCVQCDRCWESFGTKRGQQWTKYRKNHIPTLNKERKICPDCKLKEEG